MKITSEIWVNSLGKEQHRPKSNSEKAMKHYSKLPEIFTRF